MRNLIIVVATAFALSACSSVKLIYGFADTLVEQEAKFYLDLDGPDAALLERKVDDILLWHQSSMLPQYAGFLRTQAVIVESGAITREQVGATFAETRALLERTVRGITPHAATVLAGHTSAKKLDHLRKRIYERNAERKERTSQPRAQRLERRVERLEKNFSRFIGDLTSEQQKLIKRHATQTLKDSEIWVDHLQRRQRAFLSFLEDQPDAARIEPFIEKIMLRSYEVVQPEYRAFSEARGERFKGLLFDVLSRLTPDQRTEAANTLRSWANDFTDLSASAKP